MAQNCRAQEASELLQRKRVRAIGPPCWPIVSPLACDLPAISRADAREACSERSQNLLGTWNLRLPFPRVLNVPSHHLHAKGLPPAPGKTRKAGILGEWGPGTRRAPDALPSWLLQPHDLFPTGGRSTHFTATP